MAVDARQQGEAVVVEVRVMPRASRNRILGEYAGALKVALTAPPVDGAANDALVTLLAGALDVPRRSVAIVRGQRSRNKSVRIDGVSDAAIQALVASDGDAS